MGPASAVAPKALINGDTVVGSPSLEQQQAEAQGFTVTVATGAQWDAMTQAQFANGQIGRGAAGRSLLDHSRIACFQALHKAVNLSFSVHDTLFARVEGVTLRAELDSKR